MARIGMAVAASLVLALAAAPKPAAAQISFQPQVRGLGCLRPAARAMVYNLVARIGPIIVTSTCGGRHAHNSQHHRGNAIDFRPLRTTPRGAVAALRGMPEVGGIGSYSNGLVHADVGERKLAWHGRGGRGRGRAYAYNGRSRHAGRHSHRRYAGRMPTDGTGTALGYLPTPSPASPYPFGAAFPSPAPILP